MVSYRRSRRIETTYHSDLCGNERPKSPTRMSVAFETKLAIIYYCSRSQVFLAQHAVFPRASTSSLTPSSSLTFARPTPCLERAALLRRRSSRFRRGNVRSKERSRRELSVVTFDTLQRILFLFPSRLTGKTRASSFFGACSSRATVNIDIITLVIKLSVRTKSGLHTGENTVPPTHDDARERKRFTDSRRRSRTKGSKLLYIIPQESFGRVFLISKNVSKIVDERASQTRRVSPSDASSTITWDRSASPLCEKKLAKKTTMRRSRSFRRRLGIR